MRIAEKLYTQGYISYPRTETNIFPPSFDLASIVGDQTADPQWGAFANQILTRGPTPRQGSKTDNAHPPIHPTKYTNTLTVIILCVLLTWKWIEEITYMYGYDYWNLPKGRLCCNSQCMVCISWWHVCTMWGSGLRDRESWNLPKRHQCADIHVCTSTCVYTYTRKHMK